MKAILSFCAIALVAVVVAEDVFKVEDAEYIQDEQKFKDFFSCVMDQDPCPDNLKKIREVLPKYIATNCGDCSPKEKEIFDSYSKVILDKYPQQHKELMEKYGPKPQ